MIKPTVACIRIITSESFIKLRAILNRVYTCQISPGQKSQSTEVQVNMSSVMPMPTAPALNIGSMRIDYGDQEFDEDKLPGLDPIATFNAWFNEAKETQGIVEANAMTLATASREGKPSARIVLLKGYDRCGFRFFTNYESNKGKDLAENPRGCLMFYWEPLFKQVRISGMVERLSDKESTEYFHSRPRKSQIGAHASDQSRPIKSRKELSRKVEELAEKYKDESVPIPKPDYWGGYLLKPQSIEFWCGKTGRLHDRILFERIEHGDSLPNSDFVKIGYNGWTYQRLSP